MWLLRELRSISQHPLLDCPISLCLQQEYSPLSYNAHTKTSQVVGYKDKVIRVWCGFWRNWNLSFVWLPNGWNFNGACSCPSCYLYWSRVLCLSRYWPSMEFCLPNSNIYFSVEDFSSPKGGNSGVKTFHQFICLFYLASTYWNLSLFLCLDLCFTWAISVLSS